MPLGQHIGLLFFLFTHAALAERTGDGDKKEHRTREAASLGGKGNCCCMQKSTGDKSGDTALYSPDHDDVCKVMKEGCAPWVKLNDFTKQRSFIFCESQQDFKRFTPEPLPAGLDRDTSEAEDWTPRDGTPGQTMATYCSTQGQGSPKEEQGASVLRALVQEMSQNPLDTVAEDVFSLYVCVRWALTKEFHQLAGEEIKSGQGGSYADYSSGDFIPLKCSRTVRVFEAEGPAEEEPAAEEPEASEDAGEASSEEADAAGQEEEAGAEAEAGEEADAEAGGEAEAEAGGEAEAEAAALLEREGRQEEDAGRSARKSHFKYFETTMLSMADFLENEETGPLAHRLKEAQALATPLLKQKVSELFDLSAARDAIAKACPASAKGKNFADVRRSTVKELMGNCGAARWWHEKLRRWDQALPFSSFLFSALEPSWRKPGEGERVMVCFGQRVASQLQRRARGTYLLADQNAMGCHGFLKFQEAAKMIRRTLQLWRPPTCQLANVRPETTVEASLRRLEALWDLEEKNVTEGDVLKANDAVAARAAAGIASLAKQATQLAGGRNTATRLGLLLGGAAVKWAVCPLKSGADQSKLDAALGAHAQQARFVGQADPPAEECSADDEMAKMTGLECKRCSLGVMQESMPEPYNNERFICPVRPLLEPKPQLQALAKKPGACFLRMTTAQWRKKSKEEKTKWLYRGETPSLRQYDIAENKPNEDHEIIKIVSWRKAPMKRPGYLYVADDIERDLVTYALMCTPEQWKRTPRWCKASELAEPPRKEPQSSSSGSAATGKPDWSTFLYGVAKNAQGKMQRVGKWDSGEIRKRLRYRMFSETEAGALMHGASYQVKKGGADHQWDRYSVSCNCPQYDAEKEFDLRYTWIDFSNALLYEASNRMKRSPVPLWRRCRDAFTKDIRRTVNMGGLVVELRGVSLLESLFRGLRRDRRVLVRFNDVGLAAQPWNETTDNFLSSLVGVDHAQSTDAPTYGLRAVFVCGSRQEVHDLALDPTPEQLPGNNFFWCIRSGWEKYKHRNKAEFFRNDLVVRVTFFPFTACYHDQVTGDAGQASKFGSFWSKTEPESESHDFKAFKQQGAGCTKPSEADKLELPQDLQAAMKKPSYRGIFAPKGLPPGIPKEVVMEAHDADLVMDAVEAYKPIRGT